MNKQVVVIGLDSYDPHLMKTWIAQGHLNHFKQLWEQGAYADLSNTVRYCGELEELKSNDTIWPAFITGQRADKTGYWLACQYHPDDYTVTSDLVNSGFDYKDYPPFYALGDRYKVAVFDVPYAQFSDQIHGLQILGWGGHFPYVNSVSRPENLFSEITQTYGKNPILFEDGGHWWDKKYLTWIDQALDESTSRRLEICKDLLKRDSWDLFFTVVGEPHAAGHDLYNRSQPDHPLYPYLTNNGTSPDPLLKSYKAIDNAIGQLLAEIPEDTYVMCFSPNGMGPNISELLCHVVLPEILYRFNFPGKVALAAGDSGTTPPPMITKPIRNSWMGEMWSKTYEPNPLKRLIKPWIPKEFLQAPQNGLSSPYPLLEQEVAFGWMPTMWYQPLWHQMKAFALPGFTDGYIRINLEGREKNGIVAASEYDSLCTELCDVLCRLTDGRTGKPLVKKIVRTRKTPYEADPKLLEADLVIIWDEQMTDVFDSPDFGRIGPVPYFRPGSHWNRGFVMVKGPGIAPGTTLSNCETIDLPPTILSLMGAPIPESLEGTSLLKSIVAV
ncbi:MAG: alkaline phosphatase family protein [Oculatellaceae cyanobacterium bins.114]|nr:alkaline phosphatase family protein [Oculatellaceae cyanobacterium bins.114]